MNKTAFPQNKVLSMLHGLLLLAVLSVCSCTSVQPETVVAPHSSKPGILAQLTDPQLGFGEFDKDVARLQQEIDILNRGDCQCAVICGDLVNNPSVEKQREAFKAALKNLKKPCFLVRGNHDDKALFIENFGPTYYGADLPFEGYRLVVLDTNYWMKAGNPEAEKMDAMLLSELESAKVAGKKVILAGHCSIFVHSFDEEEKYFNLPKARRAWLGELFTQYPIVAYLAGHSHQAYTFLWKGVLLSNCETTSKAFDKVNFGFRRFVFFDDMIRFNTIPVN